MKKAKTPSVTIVKCPHCDGNNEVSIVDDLGAYCLCQHTHCDELFEAPSFSEHKTSMKVSFSKHIESMKLYCQTNEQQVENEIAGRHEGYLKNKVKMRRHFKKTHPKGFR